MKARERELQFELFREKLSQEQLEQLEQEAQAQVKPHIGISVKRQLEVAKDELLKPWFDQQRPEDL